MSTQISTFLLSGYTGMLLIRVTSLKNSSRKDKRIRLNDRVLFLLFLKRRIEFVEKNVECSYLKRVLNVFSSPLDSPQNYYDDGNK